MKPYKALSKREAAILAAVGRGLIPTGGPYFSLGARDIEQKWLPRADYVISRMSFFNRLGIKCWLHAIDYGWPMLMMKRLRSLRKMDESQLETLLDKVEHFGIIGVASLIMAKVIIFPAVYGVPAASVAIGYKTRFPVPDEFEGIKD
jgi:hypothetical protein